MNPNFPKDALTAADIVPVNKRAGVPRAVIQSDVDKLMAHFLSKPTRSFDEFDDTWNELHFELIHFGCLNGKYRLDFMSAIYESVLAYFNNPIARSGVLFSLYYLHQSQPSVWEKIQVRVSCDIWKSMFDFYIENIEQCKNLEAVYIFKKLQKMNVFEFSNYKRKRMVPVAENEFKKAIDTLETIEQVRRDKMKTEPTDYPGLENYKSLSKIYNNAKQTAFLTPNATLAIQSMLRESVNITENNQRMLQNVALRGPLHETDLVNQLDRVSKRFWNSKK